MTINVGARVRESETGRLGTVRTKTDSGLFLVLFDDDIGIKRHTPPSVEDTEADESYVFVGNSDRLSIRTEKEIVKV